MCGKGMRGLNNAEGALASINTDVEDEQAPMKASINADAEDEQAPKTSPPTLTRQVHSQEAFSAPCSRFVPAYTRRASAPASLPFYWIQPGAPDGELGHTS